MSKASYNNQPSRAAKSRIRIDASEIRETPDTLKFQKGIYYDFDIDNGEINTKYKMLIVGPEDSPYVGGFYMFNGQFPDQYPFYPMTMKTMTQGENIRKHPNLYTSGKCCFSFLGTWAGPPWTSCQTPDSVGVSMRSVLTNNPITNEPGWENRSDDKTKLYEDMIIYFNLRYAVCDVIEQLDKSYSSFNCFKERVYTHFVYNYEKGYYHKMLDVIKHYKGRKVNSPAYGFCVYFDIDTVSSKLKTLYDLIKPVADLSSINNIQTSTTTTNNSEAAECDVPINSTEVLSDKETQDDDKSINSKSSSKSPKKKYVRKAPKESAKNYNEGDTKKGLDGNDWVIKVNKNGVKRWAKK